ATLGISGIIHTVGNFYFGPGANCYSTLAAGASCTFSVVFKPATTGTRTGTVTVTDSATGSPHKLSLSGSGVSSGTGTPAVSLSPTSLCFVNQAVGTASVAYFPTRRSSDLATLGISGITHTVGNFYFGPGANCISTLAAG